MILLLSILKEFSLQVSRILYNLIFFTNEAYKNEDSSDNASAMAPGEKGN